jgi:hypothetical protein
VRENEDFWDGALVYAYTRAQALEDGVLVEVSEMAKEAGIRFPVAVTSAVWGGVVEPDEKSKALGQSVEGRLWDVLWMFSLAARRCSGDMVHFELIVANGRRRIRQRLKAVIGPGDDPAPVITIMLPDED